MNHNIHILEAGDKVRGKHLFGVEFTGTISSARWDTVNRNDPYRIVFVEFSAPTDLRSPDNRPWRFAPVTDIRDAICMQLDAPKFKGDTKWQGGQGDWLELVSV